MPTVSVTRLKGRSFFHETVIQGLFGIHGIFLEKIQLADLCLRL